MSKQLNYLLKFLLGLWLVLESEGTCKSSNTIKVIEPVSDTQWFIAANSHRVAWTQSGRSFRWNIFLFNAKGDTVADIAKMLSEYEDGEMGFDWLVPERIESGRHAVKVEVDGDEGCFGTSQEFTITEGSPSQAEVFLPPSTNILDVTSLTNSSDPSPTLPHEQKHMRRLKVEAENFAGINMSDYWPSSVHCTIKRVSNPSREEFLENFINPGIPAIITQAIDDWPAMTMWDFDKLEGHLTKGVKVNILDHPSPYKRWNSLRQNLAASLRDPPQVHMTDFHTVYPQLMADVRQMDIFPDNADYMQFVDEDIKPAQLSLQMAPQRSGYHWRVEQYNGSLWSALVRGHKRWGLYPPSVYFPPGVVHNNHRAQDSQSSEPFTWWAHTQPRLRADRRPSECVQKPGEILYIPSGWWWSHINLEDTITLQRWFCDRRSLRACLDELKEQSDTSPKNYSGDIFVQLRHHLKTHSPEFLTADDDDQFQSPVSGKGRTYEEWERDLVAERWQEYFGKYEIGVNSGEFDDQ
ncbi:predicted protein [Nematostella vectensis]|uniref:JmjC domain-containing protein n=1 Tax=Nematostella vectensis TaxID=45351 RepID=A7RRA5_NEMVE|nr:2-oxoglutarate and iron-dependent oxygenase JMJD4 [Nematostella vectensis]EDO45976.1 predicted protein [Nematostella vectensis]|eukprot:XP_001638039.1 predicted protein [Nematostella vectensis]